MPKSRRWLRHALVASFLLSLGLNGVLALAWQRTEQKLRLDPFELEWYAPTRPVQPAPPGTRRVVLYGDSRARSWPLPKPLAGLTFENRGIGYQSTTQVLGRLQEDVLALEPAVVVLQVGINDLKAPAADPAQRARFVQRCKQNLDQLVARCVAARAHVVVLPIFPVGPIPWYRRSLVAADLARAVREVNAFLRELGLREGVSLLDTDALLADSEGLLRPEYRRDFLHVNDAGYAALDAALHAHLSSLLPRLQPTATRVAR